MISGSCWLPLSEYPSFWILFKTCHSWYGLMSHRKKQGCPSFCVCLPQCLWFCPLGSCQSDHPELALFTHSEALSSPWVLPCQIVITSTWFARFANLAPFCFPTALQTYILCFRLTRLIALIHTNLWTFLPSYLATFFFKSSFLPSQLS